MSGMTDPNGEDHELFKGKVFPLSGSYTLSQSDNGKLFRSDSASNITLTIPAGLSEGFTVAVAMFGAGTVTASAGAGATNRSSKSALSTQYQVGSILVMKNTGSAAEFVLGGDFA